MKYHNGFTLLELMLVLAAIAVAAIYGMPHLSCMMQNNRITAELNALSAHLSYARVEAIKRGRRVSVSPQTDDSGLDPVESPDWTLGYIVYIDKNNNGVRDAGEEKLRGIGALNVPDLSLASATNNVSDYVFNADGSLNNGPDFIGMVDNSGCMTNRFISVNNIGHPLISTAAPVN